MIMTDLGGSIAGCTRVWVGREGEGEGVAAAVDVDVEECRQML